jgi:CubicO group peptidase (beta-lactamase class C family)
VEDLARVAFELLAPSGLLHPTTLADAASVQYPGLRGVLPGFGPQDPNDWGLGLEIRGTKHPHWTGARNSPRTYGHFGQSGSMLWVDPDARIALVALADQPFGPWATHAWPELADAVLDAA